MNLNITYSLAPVPFRLLIYDSGSRVLLLSGVGRAEHPSEDGIPFVCDLPVIGNRLVDHPIMDLHFDRKSQNDSLKYFLPSSASEVFQLSSIAVRYALFVDGPMATNMGNQHIRVDDPKLLSGAKEMLGDALPAKGPTDIKPRSTGSIRLQSADPWAYPVVNPNYLKDPRDVHTLRRGVRLLLRVAQTPPISDALDGDCSRADLDHRLLELSDEELDEVIRQRCETVYHPACTCRMAPDGALDNKCAYMEIKVLTIIDAGACFAIAEKLADDLKAEYAVSRDASLAFGL
ncbi:hypothetical protein GGG16DRAFT_107653 [Schizophyllum commune]